MQFSARSIAEITFQRFATGQFGFWRYNAEKSPK
jgi:hypothetical protein